MLEKKRMSQNPAIQSSACTPNREHSDPCMGNDQMIRCAVLREKNMPQAMKKALHRIWEDMVENIFKDGKEDHNRLQRKFEAVLNGSAKEDEFTKTCPNSPIIVTSYNTELQGSSLLRTQT